MFVLRVVVVAVLALLVGGLLWQSFSVPAWQTLDISGPAYPTIVLWAVLGLLALHLLVTVIPERSSADSVTAVLPDDARGRLRLFGFVLLWISYVALLPWVGFFVATATVLALSLALLERLRLRWAVPSAVLATFAVYLLFRRVFYVGVPESEVENLLDILIYSF